MLQQSAVRTFLSGWVSRFGPPTTVITDRGVQFQSQLWHNLLQFLGTSRHRTTSYHPQSNGMVERFHRQQKDGIKAHDPYTVRHDLLKILRQAVSAFKATAPRQCSHRPEQIPPALLNAEHVFVRRDAHRNPLHHPYDGPFPVLARSAKFLMINCNGRHDTVSIDRVKPTTLPDGAPAQHSPQQTTPAPRSPVWSPLPPAAPPCPHHFRARSFLPKVLTAPDPAPDEDPGSGASEDFAPSAREAPHSSSVPPAVQPSHIYNSPSPCASPIDFVSLDGVVNS
ncbi:uncharacterized protein LOC121871277 [Homarus americanus]|uniref:uncharacterized protein LOC121871277 n=1 Tax=Homarus americanus TaxID=6706 RepID=UPI001C459DCF|nr:uncharacterized protein LOC121871277 [Homarus americanus]